MAIRILRPEALLRVRDQSCEEEGSACGCRIRTKLDDGESDSVTRILHVFDTGVVHSLFQDA